MEDDRAAVYEIAKEKYERGTSLLRVGYFASAADLLEESMALHPHHVVALNLAKTYFCQGLFEEVINLALCLSTEHRATPGWQNIVLMSITLSFHNRKAQVGCGDFRRVILSKRLKSFFIAADQCGYLPALEVSPLGVCAGEVERQAKIIKSQAWHLLL